MDMVDGSWSWPDPVDPSHLGHEHGVDVDAVRALPSADGDPSTSPAMDAALSLALHGDPAAAETALLALVGSPNPVDAWAARLELGTLLMDNRPDQGAAVLLQCLRAPYMDIVANAAWNISEVVSRSGRRDVQVAYASLAVDLGNALAATVQGERAWESGDLTEARRLLQDACATAPRAQPTRTRAESQLANLWLESGPEETRSWFTSARGSVPATAWQECVPIYRNTGVVFNVEAGSASVATRYFPTCPSNCYFDSESRNCPACGRNPRSLLHCAAGRGDGVYPVLTLFDTEGGVTGALALFKDGLDGLTSVRYRLDDGHTINASVGGVGATLADLLAPAAPMVLGTLDCDGVLLLSDASRCIDDSDYTVDIEAPPGEYTVVAWVTVPVDDYDDTPRPLALGAFTGAMRAAISDCLPPLAPQQRADLIGRMWGRPDLLVNSHFASANIRIQVAQINHDAHFAQDEADRALSWYLQLAEFDDAGTHDLLRSLEPLDDSQLRTLLAQRGILHPTFPWRRQDPPSIGLTKASSGLGVQVPPTPPGIDPHLVERAEDGDIFAWNDLGYHLTHTDRLEEGLEWLARSARAGVPWAMATYNWQSLLHGQPERATALFDEVLPAMEAFVRANAGRGEVGDVAPRQLANARSNDALCRLALGGPASDALAVWSAGRWRGHVESKFHPAVVALREGREADAQTIAESLSDEERAEVQETLGEVVAEGAGWFADWCRDGLRLLSEPSPLPASSAHDVTGEARFCIACGAARTSGARFCISCGAAF